ncbi:MAG: threonine aldolase family protein [Bacteroidia bacterium]
MNDFIDVRSDTVTKPTPQMLEVMMLARVGDDVFGEDETVNELQQYAANMFGFEAGLFCPSGTMTNQIAIKLHTQPGDEVICDKLAHVYNYEGGGIAFHSGSSVKLVEGKFGIFTPNDVLNAINKDDPHFPKTSLVCIENTVNKGGGTCWSISQMLAIKEVCSTHSLKLHLDGARVFNALVALNQDASQYGKFFDTMSVCLSKGLGAPVGSVLLGSKQYIKQAVRLRKLFGGGMRQAGYIAAAGLYALKNHITRLQSDHEKANALLKHLQQLQMVTEIYPVQTNIVIFKIKPSISNDMFLAKLSENNIKAAAMAPQTFRFVMHLDITDEKFGKLLDVLTLINKQFT